MSDRARLALERIREAQRTLEGGPTAGQHAVNQAKCAVFDALPALLECAEALRVAADESHEPWLRKKATRALSSLVGSVLGLPDHIEKLAEEALEEHRAGKTEPMCDEQA